MNFGQFSLALAYQRAMVLLVGTTTSKDWARLGTEVKRRREQMNLGQSALGPSDLTVRKIERGDGDGTRPQTLHQLERSLQWRDGTIAKILDGTVSDDELSSTVLYASARLGPAPGGLSASGDTAPADVADSMNGTVSVAGPAQHPSLLQMRAAVSDAMASLARGALGPEGGAVIEEAFRLVAQAQQLIGDEMDRRRAGLRPEDDAQG